MHFTLCRVLFQGILLLFLVQDSVAYTPVFYSPKDSTQKFSRIRLSFQGGWSYLLTPAGSDDPLIAEHIRKVKSGTHYSFHGALMLSRKIGLGLQYSSFTSEHTTKNVFIYDNSSGVYRGTSIKDNVTIDFTGFSLFSRISGMGEKFRLIFNLAPGVIDFENRARVFQSFKISGKTFGLAAGLHSEYMLSRRIGAGVSVSAIAGSLSNVEITYLGKSFAGYMSNTRSGSVSRLDFSAGVRLYLF